MSVVLRVGFLRRGFILAVLKDAGTMPEVREADQVKMKYKNIQTGKFSHHGIGINLNKPFF